MVSRKTGSSTSPTGKRPGRKLAKTRTDTSRSDDLLKRQKFKWGEFVDIDVLKSLQSNPDTRPIPPGVMALFQGKDKDEVREILGITGEAADYSFDEFFRGGGADPQGLKPNSAILIAMRRARDTVSEAPAGKKLTAGDLLELVFDELIGVLNERNPSAFEPYTDFKVHSRAGHDPDEREISKEKRSKTSRKQETGIPRKAPRLWRSGHVEEMNAADFVKEVYGPAIKSGMTQADLKRLDPKLYMAFHKWCGRHSVDTRSILPSALSDADSVVARHGGRPPTRAEALAALRTGTEEGLLVFKAYESILRRNQYRRAKKAQAG